MSDCLKDQDTNQEPPSSKSTINHNVLHKMQVIDNLLFDHVGPPHVGLRLWTQDYELDYELQVSEFRLWLVKNTNKELKPYHQFKLDR